MTAGGTMFSTSIASTHTPAPITMMAPLQVLLLDDSVFDRARIRRMIEKTGMAIALDEVPSIRALEAALRLRRYDIVLIDYCLPAGDGLDALALIADAPLADGAARIMVSEHPAPGMADAALKCGCHAFLGKARLTADLLRRTLLAAMSVSVHVDRAALQGANNDPALARRRAAQRDPLMQAGLAQVIDRVAAEKGADAVKEIVALDPDDFDVLIDGLSREGGVVLH